jgi:rhomboid protease GluP
MPKHEQTISLNNIDKETALAISYQAMKDLGWTVQYAGEEKLLAITSRDWKNFPLQIMITVTGNLTVTSEMFNGESFDMRGKNKKATTAFLTAFETAKKAIDENTIENNKQAIETLKADTIKAAEQEQLRAAEIDKAMNLPGSNLYVTYAIIAINVLVFILMALDGAGIMDTNGLVHIKWGSNYTPLTLSGDWWRLITNIFIHFGIIHLLMNMYCLYMAGVYLEPMLGKIKYTVAYLCTGIAASIVSLWWHSEGVNSAGASGAIFGMYGLFLALLTTNLIPKQMRQPLLQSTVIFVVYNLAYGMKGGVDNSAHAGGLISGFIIGYIYVLGIKKEREGQKLQWIIPLVIVLTAGGAYAYLEQNKSGTENRDQILSEVKDATYKDNDKFDDRIEEFHKLDEEAIGLMNDTTIKTKDDAVIMLNKAKPLWEQSMVLVKEADAYTVSEAMHKKATRLIEYVDLRQKQNELLLTLNTTTNREENDTATKQLEETREKIAKSLDVLNGL